MSKSDLIVYIIGFIMTFILWFIPADESKGLTSTSMHLFAIFILIVYLLLFTKARISIVIAFSLGFLSLTQNFKCRTSDNLMVDCSRCGKAKSLDSNEIYQCNASKGAFSVALSGFAEPINWLVFFSYQIGKCIEGTDLGKRISFVILKHFGSSLMGIGYAIFIIELILAPFIPSNIARGGCIVLPIINSIIENINQNYHHVSSKVPDFLYFCGNHANLIISSVFLTGSATNPVVVSEIVKYYGQKYDLSFMKWLVGSFVPAAVVILITPFFIRMYLKQSNMDLEHTRIYSERMSGQMNAMTKNERYLCIVFGSCLFLWTTGGYTGIDMSLVTFLGVLALIALKLMTWDEVLDNLRAWDTFFWLGGMIVMANQLSAVGMSDLIGEYIAAFVEYIPIYPLQILILFSFYFVTMMLFSSNTGHVIAFAGPVMKAAEQLGIPKGLTAAYLAYYTLLCACLTHYTSGSAVIYYSKSNISTKRFITLGFIVSGVIIAIYSTVGSLWWKIIG
jgi:DASS family divalent anion:Na+ symporter